MIKEKEDFFKRDEYFTPLEDDVRVSVENFKRHELECPCCHLMNLPDKFILILQAFSYYLDFKFGKHITLNVGSAYRCQKHNAEVGGVPGSQHYADGIMKLGAADLSSPDLEPSILYQNAILFGIFRSVKFYPEKNFVHVDINPERNRCHAWVEGNKK